MQLISEIEKILGEDITKSGSSFYSNIDTIKKGRYLILGLNPGGDPIKIHDSIADSFKRIKDPYYNAYYEDWNGSGKPTRLQKNLQKLFEFLEEDLRKTCATNIYYERTRRESDFSLSPEKRNKYIEILKITINLVQPKVIITFGRQPYKFLLGCYDPPDKIKTIDSGHGNWKINLTSVSSQNIKVIGLPHLSIYTLYSRSDKMKSIKEFISKPWFVETRTIAKSSL